MAHQPHPSVGKYRQSAYIETFFGQDRNTKDSCVPLVKPSTHQHFNLSTHQLINPSTRQPINLSTHRLINPSTRQPINLSTHQPINLSTYQPINPSTRQPLSRDASYRTNNTTTPATGKRLPSNIRLSLIFSILPLCFKPTMTLRKQNFSIPILLFSVTNLIFTQQILRSISKQNRKKINSKK